MNRQQLLYKHPYNTTAQVPRAFPYTPPHLYPPVYNPIFYPYGLNDPYSAAGVQVPPFKPGSVGDAMALNWPASYDPIYGFGALESRFTINPQTVKEVRQNMFDARGGDPYSDSDAYRYDPGPGRTHQTSHMTQEEYETYLANLARKALNLPLLDPTTGKVPPPTPTNQADPASPPAPPPAPKSWYAQIPWWGWGMALVVALRLSSTRKKR